WPILCVRNTLPRSSLAAHLFAIGGNTSICLPCTASCASLLPSTCTSLPRRPKTDGRQLLCGHSNARPRNYHRHIALVDMLSRLPLSYPSNQCIIGVMAPPPEVKTPAMASDIPTQQQPSQGSTMDCKQKRTEPR